MPTLIFSYPWLLLLMALPLAIALLVPPFAEPRPSVVVPFFERIVSLKARSSVLNPLRVRARWPQRILLALSWIIIVLALARPQIIEPPLTKQMPMRDTLLAIDLSGSMETADFKNAGGKAEDRLTAVKEVIDSFLARRKGDRVGLIFFGSAPFVQAPFTDDLDVCRQLLAEAQVRMAGPQTAVGDAIGLAINTFQKNPNTHERVLILLTDGNDTNSQITPLKASEIARDNKITIHTISVGDPAAVGEDALDIPTLKNIAANTGGFYAHADDQNQLAAIYAQIDTLEPQKVKTISHRPRRDIYWMPLSAALALSALYYVLLLMLSVSRRTRVKPPITFPESSR